MKKNLLILCILFASSTLINAHCGGCGVGDKSVSHKATSVTKKSNNHEKLNLTNDQQKKYDEFTSSYENELKKIKEQYNTNIMSILSIKQKEQFLKNNTTEKRSCDKKDKDCSSCDTK